jgi:hypothetical protein
MGDLGQARAPDLNPLGLGSPHRPDQPARAAGDEKKKDEEEERRQQLTGDAGGQDQVADQAEQRVDDRDPDEAAQRGEGESG